MDDVKGRKDLTEHGCTGAQNSKHQVTYDMYLASGRRLLYTPSIELVAQTIHETLLFCPGLFCHLSITSCSREKRYQALSAFRTAGEEKLGGTWERG